MVKKSTAFWMIILGVFLNNEGALAPLHEMWHIMAAWIEGTSIEPHWSYCLVDHLSLFVGSAGSIGEAITFAVLLTWALKKKHNKLALFFYGNNLANILIFSIYAIQKEWPADVVGMLKFNDPSGVWAVIGLWAIVYTLALIVGASQLWYVVGQKKTSKYGKRAINNLNNFDKSLKIAQKEYKPLTLVK